LKEYVDAGKYEIFILRMARARFCMASIFTASPGEIVAGRRAATAMGKSTLMKSLIGGHGRRNPAES